MFTLLKFIATISFSLILIAPHDTHAEDAPTEAIDFQLLVSEIDRLMHQHHYNIQELKSEGYQSILKSMKILADHAKTKNEFMNGFKSLWKNGPFSHVTIGAHNGSAEQLATYLDNLNVGAEATKLNWQGDVAILTINTMMGQDTIASITKFYQAIAQKKAKALIIDLRANEGGAFAIRPLVSHLIDRPITVGYFIAQNWTSEHQRLPSMNEISRLVPWNGWSIRSFWQDVQKQSLIKVAFEPAELHLKLPVYVLTSTKTASASELATEALQSAGRIKVIGEPTAGQMLSQKPYDLPFGLQLYIPIADYYSVNTGRLEGHPIQPDINISADEALAHALKLINE